MEDLVLDRPLVVCLLAAVRPPPDPARRDFFAPRKG